MKRTSLYISKDGDIVGLHAPDDITPPVELELETKDRGRVTFKAMTAREQGRPGTKNTVLRLA